MAAWAPLNTTHRDESRGFPRNPWNSVFRDRIPRTGQVLVEFALISFVFMLLLAATMDLGRGLHAAQVAQQAADLAARELARSLLPATGITLQQLLDGDPTVSPTARQAASRVYDPDWLVFPLNCLGPGESIPEAMAAQGAPPVNQLLLPLMIFDDEHQALTGERLVRYPGPLVRDATARFGYRVGPIPLLEYGPAGEVFVGSVPAFEEIRFGADRHSAFDIASPERGIVALRINYPFQAAAMGNYHTDPQNPFLPNFHAPISAADAGAIPDGIPGTYAGPHSLGRHLAHGTTIRPYRRILTAQALHRRELLAP